MGICVSLFKVSFHISIFLSSLVGRKEMGRVQDYKYSTYCGHSSPGRPLILLSCFRFLISYLLFFQSSFKLNIVRDLL